MQSREPAREQESLKRTRGMEQESLRWKGNHCGELQWGKKKPTGLLLIQGRKEEGFLEPTVGEGTTVEGENSGGR